jgi:hypothetical protein
MISRINKTTIKANPAPHAPSAPMYLPPFNLLITIYVKIKKVEGLSNQTFRGTLMKKSKKRL